jgi:hypothetical protein
MSFFDIDVLPLLRNGVFQMPEWFSLAEVYREIIGDRTKGFPKKKA